MFIVRSQPLSLGLCTVYRCTSRRLGLRPFLFPALSQHFCTRAARVAFPAPAFDVPQPKAVGSPPRPPPAQHLDQRQILQERVMSSNSLGMAAPQRMIRAHVVDSGMQLLGMRDARRRAVFKVTAQKATNHRWAISKLARAAYIIQVPCSWVGEVRGMLFRR